MTSFKRNEHFLQRHVGLQPDDTAIDQLGCRRERVAVDAMQLLDVERSPLESLVFLQSPHQLGARIGFLLGSALWPRQQHARFYFGKCRRHHEILARQFELHATHHVDVLHVLARDLGNGNIEDVQVLPADQVQQQVERAFERLQENLQRIRRNVEVFR